MVYSPGLAAVTERIDEIRRRMGEAVPAQKPSTAASFEAVLETKQAQQPEKSELVAMVEQQANQLGMDPNLVKAVVKAESGFNPEAVSSAGAKGLMQLMPTTAQELGVRSVFDPQDNVKGGTQYLKGLLSKYQSVPKALAAYNAGPGTVDRYGGIPPYPETQTYVNRVMNYAQQYTQQATGGH